MSILTIPTPSDKFVLLTDASARGIAGVLSVIRKEEELPVGFFSRQLRPAETRHSATELEGLTLVKAIQHFRIYILGQEFSVETDHKALAYLHTSKHLNGWVMRWALLLQPYTFTMRHRPGARNGNADGHLGKHGQSKKKNKNDQLLWKGVVSGLNPDLLLQGWAGTALQKNIKRTE